MNTEQWEICLERTFQSSSFLTNMKHFILFVDYNTTERSKKNLFFLFCPQRVSFMAFVPLFLPGCLTHHINPKARFSTPRSQRDSEWCGIWAQSALVRRLFVVPAFLNHVGFPRLLPGAFAPSLPASVRITSVPFPHTQPSVIYIRCRAGSCKCLLLMFIFVYWLLLSPQVILLFFYP